MPSQTGKPAVFRITTRSVGILDTLRDGSLNCLEDGTSLPKRYWRAPAGDTSSSGGSAFTIPTVSTLTVVMRFTRSMM